MKSGMSASQHDIAEETQIVTTEDLIADGDPGRKRFVMRVAQSDHEAVIIGGM
jgi:hypothetical protein